MKNTLMMIAAMGMFGGALAQETTVVQPVSVQVKNVCSYNTPDQSDVNGKTFTNPGIDLGTYKANADGAVVGTTPRDGNNAGGFLYVFHCTAGTSFTSVAYNDQGTTSSPETGTHTGMITLHKGSEALNVKYNVTFTKYGPGDTTPRGNTANGDYHYADATFQVPAGQWNATQGSYAGDLTLVISYN